MHINGKALKNNKRIEITMINYRVCGYLAYWEEGVGKWEEERGEGIEKKGKRKGEGEMGREGRRIGRRDGMWEG